LSDHQGEYNLIENLSRKQFIILIIVAVVSGIFGGAISSWHLITKYIDMKNRTMQTVRAQKFEVINEYGKILGTFESGSNGPSLNLFDSAGHLKANLSYYSIDFDRGHSSLNLYGNDEKLRIQLGLFQKEMPILTFYGKDGKVLWEKKIEE